MFLERCFTLKANIAWNIECVIAASPRIFSPSSKVWGWNDRLSDLQNLPKEDSTLARGQSTARYNFMLHSAETQESVAEMHAF